MARSRAKPRQQHSPVLVIVLVLLILLNIGLGVMLWGAYSAKEDLAQDLKKAEKLADDRGDELNKQKVIRSLWRLMVGFDDEEDRKDLLTYGRNNKKVVDAEKEKGAAPDL